MFFNTQPYNSFVKKCFVWPGDVPVKLGIKNPERKDSILKETSFFEDLVKIKKWENKDISDYFVSSEFRVLIFNCFFLFSRISNKRGGVAAGREQVRRVENPDGDRYEPPAPERDWAGDPSARVRWGSPRLPQSVSWDSEGHGQKAKWKVNEFVVVFFKEKTGKKWKFIISNYLE